MTRKFNQGFKKNIGQGLLISVIGFRTEGLIIIFLVKRTNEIKDVQNRLYPYMVQDNKEITSFVES